MTDLNSDILSDTTISSKGKLSYMSCISICNGLKYCWDRVMQFWGNITEVFSVHHKKFLVNIWLISAASMQH